MQAPMRTGAAALFALAALFVPPLAQADTLKVEGGEIADAAANSSGVRLFKGLPYAAPPVGDLRWRPPAPVTPWQGALKADVWGPRCMQANRIGDIDPLNKRMSEDCLYLNVWTAAQPAAPAPVMVFIYGGSNNVGSGSQPGYDGGALAQKGVVVVTINYRLDAFGFLALPDLTKESGTNSSGNYALLDQIAALKWVKANIAAFGGDPRRVTVFGESAGAFDISLLMASPLTEGLFSGVIGESGGALGPLPAFGPKPLKQGEELGAKFMQALGAASLAEARTKSADEVMQAGLKNGAVYGLGVVDGYVVPDAPAKIFAAGRQRDVPLLAGFNADEGTLFAPRFAKFGEGQPSFADRAKAQFKDRAEALLRLYPSSGSVEDDKAAFAALFGDELIGYGSWAWAERAALSGKSPVYRYHFTRRPPGPVDHGMFAFPNTTAGVYHSAELYSVFNNLRLFDMNWEDADRHLADVVSTYWTNFAKTGDPNSEGLPKWPAYKPGGGGEVMELGAAIGPRPEPNRARYEFLDGYFREAAGM